MTGGNNSKCLIILGMHRSYTSLVAGWLEKCGLDIGNDTLGAGVGNESGHFEDLEFLRLHESILRDNGLPSTGLIDFVVSRFVRYEKPRFYEAGFSKLRISGERKNEANALLSQKPAQFGWKEPRTCLFMELYRELVPTAQSIVLVRHYDLVVDSLLRRDATYLGEQESHRKPRTKFQKLHAQTIARQDTMQNAYLRAWTHYNSLLLEHVRTTGCPVILDPVSASENILDTLILKKFDLQRVPITNVVNETTTSESATKLHKYGYRDERKAKAVFEALANAPTRIG